MKSQRNGGLSAKIYAYVECQSQTFLLQTKFPTNQTIEDKIHLANETI